MIAPWGEEDTMSKSTMYRRARKARAQLTAAGCTDFAILAHGAGQWSIEYRTATGEIEVQAL